MKVFSYAILSLFFYSITSYAQLGEGIFLRQVDAESVSTGGSLIDFSTSTSASISFHVQRPYSLKALDRTGVQLVIPFTSMQVCAAYVQNGDDILTEKALQVRFAKIASKTTQINIGCGLFMVRSINGDAGNGVYADLGIQYTINESLKVGCRLINPTGALVNTEGNKKPLYQSSIIGLIYCPATLVDIHLEVEKRPQVHPISRVGLSYKLDDAFVVMGGLSTFPLQPTFGAGVQTTHLLFTLGVQMHAQLGLTPAVTCSYIFRRKS